MLPKLNTMAKSNFTVSEFRGINRNDYGDTAELQNSVNIITDSYPYAVPRAKRGIYADSEGNGIGNNFNGIAAKQGFCFIEGTRFFYMTDDGIYRDVGEVSDCEKQLVSMGAYVLIFPDKKYFNSTMYLHGDDEEWLKKHNLTWSPYFGSLEAHEAFSKIKITLCDVYGEEYKFDSVGKDTPKTEQNGYIWLDISTTPAKIMQYSDTYYGWVELTTTYVKLTVEGDYTNVFNSYDGVTLSGFPDILADFNSATVLYYVQKSKNGAETEFVIPGIITPSALAKENGFTYDSKTNSATYSNSTNPIKFDRTVPDMDYVCELDNRLWGCSSLNHEIYASKIGSPFNFNSFIGSSNDSWSQTIGSDGDFTGCISHLGYVLFFKENMLHKVYGTKPTNFQVTTVSIRGVEKGSFRSLCIVNETLFYKSKDGVMVFQGALPEKISDNLGTYEFEKAVADALGSKYYISMFNKTVGTWELFVYDCDLGLWSKLDDTQFIFTLSTLTELFYVDGKDNKLKTINGTGNSFTVARNTGQTNENGVTVYENTEYSIDREANINWSFETRFIDAGILKHKYFSKLLVYFEIFQNSTVTIYLKYDNSSKWERVATKQLRTVGSETRFYPLPIMPKRCQRIKLKVEGIGQCVIKAIDFTVEIGSEFNG